MWVPVVVPLCTMLFVLAASCVAHMSAVVGMSRGVLAAARHSVVCWLVGV